MNFNSTTFTGLNSIYVNRDPIYDTELCTKKYTDKIITDESIVTNTRHTDLKDHNITNIRFLQITQPPQIDTHATNRIFVTNLLDNATLLRLDRNEQLNIPNQDFITLNSAYTSPETVFNIPINNQHLVRNNQDNDFNNYKLTNILSVSVTHEAQEDNDLVTLGYVKSLHEDNERSRRDIGLNFYNESSELVKNNITNDFNDNKILNVQSIEINDEPTNINHACNKEYVDSKTDYFSTYLDNNRPLGPENVAESKGHIDMNNFNIENVRFMSINQDPQVNSHPVILSYFNKHLDESSILRLNDDSNERYLQIRQGNTAYNLQIYNKTQLIDTTEIIYPNTGHDLLYKWAIICNNIHGEGKPQDFLKSTKTKSPSWRYRTGKYTTNRNSFHVCRI